MFPTTAMRKKNDLASTYARVGLETGMHEANPHKLILMLFDGALVTVASAANHMRMAEIAEKGQAISKAIDIIANGLQASLDVETGGELAERLGALYEYMISRLLHANLQNSVAALQEVSGLLAELRGAWGEIANDPAISSRNGGPASG